MGLWSEKRQCPHCNKKIQITWYKEQLVDIEKA